MFGLPIVLLVVWASATLSTGCAWSAPLFQAEGPGALSQRHDDPASAAARGTPPSGDARLAPPPMVAPPLPSHARQDRPAARCELAFFAAPRLDPGMFVQAADWPPAALAGLGEGGDLLRDDFPPPGELISAETAPGAAGLAAGPDDPLAEVLEPLGSGETRFEARWRIAKSRIRGDHGGYYSARTCARLAYGLAFGSILANTSLDQDFQDWYQDDVRSEATDDLADWLNPLGNGWILVPTFACLAVADTWLEDSPAASIAGELGCRVSRAYLVGAPPMVFMQYLLGATRPDAADPSSHWELFNDCKAVSGHAFIGAVPFITAAMMTDSLVLKSGLYACSALPALARLNEDCHYLSQIILGWWMACLACQAVDQTQSESHALTLAPIASAGGIGFGAIYEY